MIDTEVRYEVWVEEGDTKRKHGGESNSTPSLELACVVAIEHDSEEAANAKLENREVNRRFFVVRCTTTREEL